MQGPIGHPGPQGYRLAHALSKTLPFSLLGILTPGSQPHSALESDIAHLEEDDIIQPQIISKVFIHKVTKYIRRKTTDSGTDIPITVAFKRTES